MEWLLKNLNLDVYQCNSDKLKDEEFTLQTVRDLTDELDMKSCLEPTVEKSYIGLTGGIGLMTSHALLSNIPSARQLSSVVISSCKDFNSDEVIEWMLKKFEGKKYEAILTQYDIPKGPHKKLSHKTEKMIPLRRECIRVCNEIDINGISGFQAAEYDLPLLGILGKEGKEAFIKWQEEKAKGVKVSQREYKFQPMGETGVFQYSGFTDFHHTWPEHGFVMNHTRYFWTPTLLDKFSYAYHGPNSKGISLSAYNVGGNVYTQQSLPENRSKNND